MAVAFGWQRKGALAVRGVSLGGRGVRFSFAGRFSVARVLGLCQRATHERHHEHRSYVLPLLFFSGGARFCLQRRRRVFPEGPGEGGAETGIPGPKG